MCTNMQALVHATNEQQVADGQVHKEHHQTSKRVFAPGVWASHGLNAANNRPESILPKHPQPYTKLGRYNRLSSMKPGPAEGLSLATCQATL